ncbi:MAG: hypothetical protein IJS65_05700, partial [Clostridia bacterium]|nr:hypothetical protein [Clostridia bacterium]
MIYHVWLSRLNISRRKAFALACMPGGAKAAFEAPPRELASYARLNKRDIEELSDKSLKTAEKIIK